MKKFLLCLALATGATCATAQPSVGVSIGINQPGVYGRINIDRLPQPEVVYERPVVIEPQPYVERRQPIYLYVPSEHQRNWGRYCGRYGACGQRVYFVREQWVRERYTHDHPEWSHDGRSAWDHRDRAHRESDNESRGARGHERHADHDRRGGRDGRDHRDDRREDGDRRDH